MIDTSKKKKATQKFHFRRYKKTEGGKTKKGKHPKLIIDECGNNYGFIGLTESKKRGHHNNIELQSNPQKGNKNKAYLRREVRYDDKRNFSEKLSDYNLSKADEAAVIAFLENRKKKK